MDMVARKIPRRRGNEFWVVRARTSIAWVVAQGRKIVTAPRTVGVKEEFGNERGSDW
jgi:hypothetical protein